jgi:glycerol kinase
MQKMILAIDQGTTSSRAILFDKNGDTVAKTQVGFAQIYPQPGWVEHDPMKILSSQLSAVRKTLKAAKAAPGQIMAVGITNQRETTVVWERETGRPITNAIVWQCRRTAEICENLKARGLSDMVTQKTGLVIDPYFSGTKIRWILDNIPHARQRAEKGDLLFGTVDSWLIWNLTNKKVRATDVTNASRTMLFDIDKLCWDETLCRELQVPLAMLPEVKASSADYGHIADLPGLKMLAGVPICGVAGDQQAALFGQACFAPGEAKNTYGTGCFLLMNTGTKRVHSQNRLLSTVAHKIGDTVEYALEGSVFNAGSVIQWLRDELGLIKSAPEIDILAASVKDTGGVVFVPAFTGLGAPHWDAYARGALFGLTRGTRKEHIARAVLESIAHQVADLVTAMQGDAGISLASLKIDGGAAVSDVMMQFQADLLNTAVDRPKNIESTALGAAFLAGLHCGFWKDRAALAQCRTSERIFTPAMPQEERARRMMLWNRAIARAENWIE